MNFALSVVVPCRNDGLLLGFCLQHIREAEEFLRNSSDGSQFGPATIDLIVVNHLSSDNPERVAEYYAARVLNYEGENVSGARNRGAWAAYGPILCFIDADCLVKEDYFCLVLSAMSDSGDRIVGTVPELPTPSHPVERLWLGTLKPQDSAPLHVSSAGLSIKTELFKRLEGFDERLPAAEDYELCVRARERQNVSTVCLPSIKLTHLGNPTTLSGMFRQGVWYGAGESAVYLRTGDKTLLSGSAYFTTTLGVFFGSLCFLIFSMWFIAPLAMSCLKIAAFARGALAQRALDGHPWYEKCLVLVMFLTNQTGRSAGVLRELFGIRSSAWRN